MSFVEVVRCWPMCVLVVGPLGRSCGANHGQLLSVSSPGPPGRNYKVICIYYLSVLGLRMPEKTVLQINAGCH